MTLSISNTCHVAFFKNHVVNYYYIKLCLKRDDAISYPVQFLYYKQNILKSLAYISVRMKEQYFFKPNNNLDNVYNLFVSKIAAG